MGKKTINKPKGKSGKLSGAGKVKTEIIDRASFFRLFFRSLDMDEPDKIRDLLDKGLMEMGFDSADVDDEDELEQAYEDALEKVTDDAYEMGLCLRDNIIPFDVRWYTGQACSFEAESDDEDEDDAEDDEEEEGDETSPTKEGEHAQEAGD